MRYGMRVNHVTGERTYWIDGQQVSEREYRRRTPNRLAEFAAGAPMTDRPGTWPMESDAAGVHPSQRSEAQEHANRIGVPTEFNAEGNPVFRSPRHRKRYCEAVGIFDRNGGYGDPQKK